MLGEWPGFIIDIYRAGTIHGEHCPGHWGKDGKQQGIPITGSFHSSGNTKQKDAKGTEGQNQSARQTQTQGVTGESTGVNVSVSLSLSSLACMNHTRLLYHPASTCSSLKIKWPPNSLKSYSWEPVNVTLNDKVIAKTELRTLRGVNYSGSSSGP